MNSIETINLTRKFGTRVAVDDLSIVIPKGTVFGFLGPNGAGKTTSVRMLAALIEPTSGTALVDGRRLGADNLQIRRSVGILTETPGLYDKLTALQNLVFFAGLYELSEKLASGRAEVYLKALNLWDRRDEKVGVFSKGMRQKLAIARAFLHDPAVVFLDEPTAGLDPEAARTVHDFIRTLKSEGRTIFLTTHNLTEADALCDVIGIFRTQLLRFDTPANLRQGLFGRGTIVRLASEAGPWLSATRALPFVLDASANNGTLSVRMDDPDADNPRLVAALVEAGAPIKYIEPNTHSLEDVYLQLVGPQ